MTYSGGPLDNQTWNTNGWVHQKLLKFGFRTHTTALRQVQQSSILSLKLDCPAARQNVLLATLKFQKWNYKQVHIKMSQFTEVGDVWLDSDHMVSFQKSNK